MLPSRSAAIAVPGLYTHEELEPLLAPLKEQMGDAGFAYRTPYDFFLARIRTNLHIVVGMDPQHPQFLARCERNPALYTRCALLWFGAWRKASVMEVATALLADTLAATAATVPSEVLLDVAGEMHATFVARGEAAPRDVISLVKSFAGIYAVRKRGLWGEGAGRLLARRNAQPAHRTLTPPPPSCPQSKTGGSAKEVDRLRAGLSKLEEAQRTVDELTKSASVQRGELRVKQAAADKAMNDITEALSLASDRRREVETLQVALTKAEGETRSRKAAVEAELAGVMPLVEEAKAAVGSIRRENLDEIKSLKMPPDAIADVLSAVLMMLGVDDTTWQSMKKFLGRAGVKEEIMSYDAGRLNPKLRAAVKRILKEKGDSFEKSNIARASVAAVPLAAWVVANVSYSETLEKIAPLQGQLDEATAALQGSQAQLERNQIELAELDARVKALKDDFKARTSEAETLKQALARTEDTLHRATSLLGQLSGERDRWRKRVDDIAKAQASLPLHALQAAAFVTYLGGCSEEVRAHALHSWHKVVLDVVGRKGGVGKTGGSAQAAAAARFSPQRFLGTESDALAWKAQGLPSDTLSTENALIILNTSHAARVPFVVDPASAATSWLQRHLEGDKAAPLEVLNAQDPRFQTQVELAVRFGKTLLVTEVDRVDPSLYPLLRRDFFHQGPRLVVHVGDKQLDVNERFRLFFASRNPRPDIAPDVRSLVAEVNFTVTRSGLESQLLALTIQHEQPELESRKSNLLQREEELKMQLVGVESSLLDALATSTGNILDNTALLDSLAKAKSKSSEIAAALEGSEKASVELDTQRNVYRPFAAAGSRLYFSLQALRTVNHMYQYSLATFLALFTSALKAPEDVATGLGGGGGGGGGGVVGRRITALVAQLETSVLFHVGQSLLKADRLMFALHLVRSLHPDMFVDPDAAPSSGSASPAFADDDDEAASSQLWSFFMGDIVVADVGEGGGAVGRDFPLWAPRDRAAVFKAFSSTFPALTRALNFADTDRWGRWAQSPAPERDFAAAVVKITTPFQRLVVVQTLRPDRLVSAMQLFVCDALGIATVNPPPVSLSKLADAATPTTPILMIATTGADPSRDLSEYAATVVGRERYVEVAMGGGVQDEALRALRKAAGEGDWVCLKNLHLVTAWLPTLEKELNMLKPHSRFRLWVTTECHPAFPTVLLQASLKVTFEAPPGVRKNLERTYEAWGPDTVGRGTPLRGQLLFMLAWLNAVVQERRTFVPQGWTKAYEFSFGDLRAGVNVLDVQLARAGGDRVPWAYLHGLIENTVYGGRVDNPSDLRVLRAYLATVFHPDVLSGRNGRALARGLPLPASNKVADFTAAIATLPETDSPSLFGLPDNIERSVQRVTSTAVVAGLKSLRAVAAAASGFDRDLWKARLTPVLDVWDRLVSADAGVADAAVGALPPGADPITAFVHGEGVLALRLVRRVASDLGALRKVLAGSELLTPAVQSCGVSLMADTVPDKWSADWEGPETPVLWMQGMVQRRVALMAWARRGTAASVLSTPVRMNDLFRPATFLNALRQYTAHALRGSGRGADVAMDTLKLVSSWDVGAVTSRAPVVCTVTGLMLQGAIFDAGRATLQDALGDAAEVVLVPDLALAWVTPDVPDPHPAASTLTVPLYQSLDRSRAVADIGVPCGTDKAKWVLAGVALFLEAV